MISIGIRELKACSARVLTSVKQGERVTVTDRGRRIAIISPTAANADDERIDSMVRDGTRRLGGREAAWSPAASPSQEGRSNGRRSYRGPPLSVYLVDLTPRYERAGETLRRRGRFAGRSQDTAASCRRSHFRPGLR